MRKLSNTFMGKNRRTTPTLVLPTKAGETAPRKINVEDYEIIREYAFKNKITMLDATERLHNKLKILYEKDKNILDYVSKNEHKESEQKSIRLTTNFNDFLKMLSNESRIPVKYIISHFIKEILGK